tara:strand:- start:491 stop:1453 length:963 start_codon:yes stop_codon:yes gene_type:complete
MNVVIFTLVLLFIFYIIQRNSKFQNKNYPINSGERGKDITSGFDNIFKTETRKEKKIKLLNAIRNISESDKVVLTEVVDKWSLNKNVIDPGTNKQSIEIVKDVMEKIGLLSDNNFYIKNIENVYVMKDKHNNFRTIISSFIYDIKNFHTIKIIMDVVYFENVMYINHIDIDESGIKNVLQHYDIKYKSQGILTNYNNFDQNVEMHIDNYYKEKYKVVPLDSTKILDLSGVFSFSDFKKKLLPKGAPTRESPIFCDKESFDWDSKGINLPGNENCIFNNPSIKHYPYQPLNVPGGIVNNVHVGQYSWLKDPSRGHTVNQGS